MFKNLLQREFTKCSIKTKNGISHVHDKDPMTARNLLELGHLVVGQSKIKDVNVFEDTLRIRAFWDRRQPALDDLSE